MAWLESILRKPSACSKKSGFSGDGKGCGGNGDKVVTKLV